MNINNTDHFLLASQEEKRSGGASPLELALIVIGVISILGLGSLLL